MSSSKPKLSIFELLTLVHLPFLVIPTILAGIRQAYHAGITLKFYIICRILRVVLGHLPPRHMQALAPSTIEAYETWMQKKRAGLQASGEISLVQFAQTSIVPLPNAGDAHILWIGDPRTASRVVLFIHGGGYIASLLSGHMEWCWRAYMTAPNGSVGDTAVAVLHYSLIPVRFPTPLKQATAALNHLLGSGVKPERIWLGGDSAGGNLVVQLLRHALEPLQEGDLPKVNIGKGDKFGGAFLVSPWLSGKTESRSFRENEDVDMLSAWIIADAAERQFAIRRLGTEVTTNSISDWGLPVDGNLNWVARLGSIVEKVYITAGEKEVLRDSIIAFSEAIRKKAPKLDLRREVLPQEGHDFILIEGELRQSGDAMQRMRLWFNGLQ